MLTGRPKSGYGAGFHRKRALRKAALVFFAVFLIVLIPALFIKWGGSGVSGQKDLRALWESGSFAEVYAETGAMLQETPLDYFLLTSRGFSAYQLASAQINHYDTQTYIDDCIWSLRKAMLSGDTRTRGQLYYVLGKAYYDKGSGYADLAVKYLEKARDSGYGVVDIPQYLGLAYAAVRDYRSSVAAFSLALGGPDSPSDVLLLSIARSYLALEEYESAGAYLIRCVDVSKDSKLIASARLLLGSILAKKGDASGAEAQYLKVLEEEGENADAHYQLGELYDTGGDPIRARAEWRRAVRIDPAHRQARARLNI
ncbi:MAG: tetratricopeptide repeat protein [Treponema sp.]|jgi:tetratricopeptide (TPR) repeat protein|nr:tetratricopeptide repeat protein [Treponema sp.]